jgi:TldD protein
MAISTQEITDLALAETKKAGADYADVRVARNRRQSVRTEDTFVQGIEQEDMWGYGIRVLQRGSWGFASSTAADLGEVRKVARLAADMARANAEASLHADPVTLTEDEPQTGSFKTSLEEDPFQVPVSEKIDLLTAVGEKAGAVKGVTKVVGWLIFFNVQRTFASTEGAAVTSDVTQCAGEYRAWATGGGDAKTRSFTLHPLSAGYEHVRGSKMIEEAERVGREAVGHLNAPSVTTGKKDLVLMPTHLALTIHESVGHATELDRALGMEESLAGRTFAVPELLGKLDYGSKHITFLADNTLPGGLATMGFDDDGIRGGSWHIVRDGVFVGYSTNREVADFIGEKRSRGANRADSYASFPIVRIPNLSLMPGKEPLTPDELIADTKDGILIDGMGSFSIDQMRCNFQFGGDAFFEIKNGKVTGQLKDVTYQAITTDFWNSCDGVCDERFFEPYGILSCGKGDPVQTARMTHGSAPARFRQINVGGIR